MTFVLVAVFRQCFILSLGWPRHHQRSTLSLVVTVFFSTVDFSVPFPSFCHRHRHPSILFTSTLLSHPHCHYQRSNSRCCYLAVLDATILYSLVAIVTCTMLCWRPWFTLILPAVAVQGNMPGE